MCIKNFYLDNNTIGNADETHYVFKINYWEDFGFINDEEVRYLDKTSGTEIKTIIFRIISVVNGIIYGLLWYS